MLDNELPQAIASIHLAHEQFAPRSQKLTAIVTKEIIFQIFLVNAF